MKTFFRRIAGCLKKNTPDRRHLAGYTLVEVMVSGILMTFSISAVVAVVGTGSQLGVSDDNRRQARAIVRTDLEQTYDFRNYGTVPNGAVLIDSVAINPREGTALIGTRTVRVVSDSINTDNCVKVPVKRVTVTLKWTDLEGTADSIVLTKLLADIQ